MGSISKVVKDNATLATLLNSEGVQQSLADVAPAHLPPAKIAKLALIAAGKNNKIYQCTTASVLQSIMHAAQLGLKFDGVGGEGYLVPYKQTCTFIIGYKGLLQLARNSGEIVRITAEIVCECDGFSWKDGLITHEVEWREPRGAMQAVYARAFFKDGGEQSAVMTLEEVEKIRDASPGARKQDSPWHNHPEEMAKKTALRRLVKMLPQSVDLQAALDRENILDEMMRGDDRPRPVSPLMKHIVPTVPAEDVAEDSVPVEEAEGEVVGND
jgi:recombination protein RecT